MYPAVPSTTPGIVGAVATWVEIGRLRVLRQLREAEVRDLHAAVARGAEEDILGLQVAMDDAALVSRRHTARCLNRDVERCPMGKRAAQQRFAQRLTFEQFGDDIGFIPVDAHVEHSNDVGMAERGGRSRLALEALQAGAVTGELGPENFERNVASQPAVVGAIHLAHSARAERRNDLIRTEAEPE